MRRIMGNLLCLLLILRSPQYLSSALSQLMAFTYALLRHDGRGMNTRGTHMHNRAGRSVNYIRGFAGGSSPTSGPSLLMNRW